MRMTSLVLSILLIISCEWGALSFHKSRYLRILRQKHHFQGTEQWFVQRLDHFNAADQRVWKQRFYINDTFYQPGGPVFLMIGGEGTANPAWMDHGSWINFAEKLGAMCLLIEHRFYGKSQPTTDLSTSNLQYLRSDQALADLAHFRAVVDVKMNLTHNKWVAFGGSYPGSLAAWFRLKYPHLVYAAVASSAPVQTVINFSEYLEVVNYSLESYSTSCPLLVKDASDTLVELLPNTNTYSQITLDFQLCEPLEIKSKMDSAYLLETLAGNFMDVVQYNKDNRVFEDPKGTNITVEVVCTIMENSSLGIPYKRYAKVSQLLLDTYEEKCLDASYSKFLSDMLNTSWSAPAADGSRQWAYQSCTEFGYYQSTESLRQPFSGFPLSYKLQQCIDLFGPLFNPVVLADAVQHTNENYGGHNIKGNRIMFPNGSNDPWHILGVTKGHKAIYIQGTAHCADMYPEQQSDVPQLREAREEIFQRLKSWVKQ
ncbi:putative serine protease K12H4.7 [Amblyraja radiata]|uniref:putative serine protease K12H4.7 n=1 Tax=Amblyraja radiata TaxID=386614 RepID=UPI001402B035|nr:putative serine protease K12H4.7 [Amblyraja radiata]